MTGDEFQKLRRNLGFASNTSFANFIGIGRNTMSEYNSIGPPKSIAVLMEALRMMRVDQVQSLRELAEYIPRWRNPGHAEYKAGRVKRG